jgi:hypothetical protein
MTHQEFENYLALVSRLLRLNRAERDAIGLELRDHLELRVAELVAMGHVTSDATRQALEEFGDAAGLAQQFQLISRSYQRRWMMRFATLCIACVFAGLVFLMAMWPDDARFGTPESILAQEVDETIPVSSTPAVAETVSVNQGLSETTRRNRLIDEKLTKPIEWDFNETPFSDVRSMLANQLEANVFLDQTAKDDSLTDDAPVTFVASSLPGKDALHLMLRDYNATYVVQRGVINVISLDVATDPEYMRRKIFNCAALFNSENFYADPDELIALVQKMVDPDNWLETGGSSTIVVFGDLLVVSATEPMLEQVGDLLQDIAYDLNARGASSDPDDDSFESRASD